MKRFKVGTLVEVTREEVMPWYRRGDRGRIVDGIFNIDFNGCGNKDWRGGPDGGPPQSEGVYGDGKWAIDEGYLKEVNDEVQG